MVIVKLFIVLFLFILDDKICFDVKISTEQYADLEWQIGACYSNRNWYQTFEKYIERCCITPGQHTLTCINKQQPFGWGTGYIEIQGHRYCDDFMSYRLMQKITINSTKKYKFSLKSTIYNNILIPDILIIFLNTFVS